MDYHVDAHPDPDPGNRLAPSTLKFNVLVASCSIIGLIYLTLSCVVTRERVRRARDPHPHHFFSSDRNRICPRWMRTIEAVGTLLVVPLWPLAIPYYAVKEMQSKMEERRVIKEEEERLERQREEKRAGGAESC